MLASALKSHANALLHLQSALLSTLPAAVRIVEVGPRDGLQNTPIHVPTDIKVSLINQLASSGLVHVEASSFVSPKWVPQFKDATDVMSSIDRVPGVTYSVLTPNMKGLEQALRAKASEVAIFAAATDEFSHKNLNCSVTSSLARYAEVVSAARAESVPVRGYVSVAFNCPYRGAVRPDAAAAVAQELLSMGCYEVSIGDTTGAATPAQVDEVLRECCKLVPAAKLAGHFHDTYGQALCNVLAAMNVGVTVFDSSIAGLGGCPFAPGASGNLATEDLTYMLNGLNISHGVSLDKIVGISDFICKALNVENHSRVAKAMLAKQARLACSQT